MHRGSASILQWRMLNRGLVEARIELQNNSDNLSTCGALQRVRTPFIHEIKYGDEAIENSQSAQREWIIECGILPLVIKF